MKIPKRVRKRLPKVLRKVGPVGIGLTAAQAAWAVRDHWRTIPADRRARLRALLVASNGRPSKLSKSERRELKALLRELRLPRMLRRISRVAATGTGRS